MIKFKTIVCDPPWLERGGGKSVRGAQRHYPLMHKQDIARVMRDADCGGMPDRSGCHLWMWATSNHLKDALWLMEVLGFEYKTTAVWVKGKTKTYDSPSSVCAGLVIENHIQLGLGQYMRHAHELLLLGTMGQAMVPPPECRMPSVILAPRTEHSRKPEKAYELIETISPAPRLEMFARRERKRWTVWGDSV